MYCIVQALWLSFAESYKPELAAFIAMGKVVLLAAPFGEDSYQEDYRKGVAACSA